MCWQQTGHGKIDPAMGQFSKRLSVIIIEQLVDRSNIVLTRVIDNTSLHAVTVVVCFLCCVYVKPRLHDTTGCHTGLTTGLTTGCNV